MDLLESLKAAFSIFTFSFFLSDKARPVVPLSARTGSRNITETSSRVGINSPQYVIKVCVSVLYREIRNSKSAWLLVMEISRETSTAFLVDTSDKISDMFLKPSTSSAHFL